MSAITGPNLIRNSITRLWYLNIFSQKPFNIGLLTLELIKILYIIEIFLSVSRYSRSRIRNSVLRKNFSRTALRILEPATFRLINYRLQAKNNKISFFGNYTWRSEMLSALPITSGFWETAGARLIKKRLKKLKDTRYILNPLIFKDKIFELASPRGYSTILLQTYISEITTLIDKIEPRPELTEDDNIPVEVERTFYGQLLTENSYSEQLNLLNKLDMLGDTVFDLEEVKVDEKVSYYQAERTKNNVVYKNYINKLAGNKWRMHFRKWQNNGFMPTISNKSNKYNRLHSLQTNITRYANFNYFVPTNHSYIPIFWYTQIFNKLFGLKTNSFLSQAGCNAMLNVQFQTQFVIPAAIKSSNFLKKNIYQNAAGMPKNISFRNLLNLIPATLNFQALHLLARQVATELARTKKHKRIIFLLRSILTIAYMQFRAQPLNAKAGLSGLEIKIIGRPEGSERTQTTAFVFGQTPKSSFTKKNVTQTTAVAKARIGTFSITITTVA